LARQINYEQLHSRVVAAASYGPFCGISAYVDNFFRLMRKDDRERFFKADVGVKMIKVKPAFLYPIW
jgi:hypothetical protein